MSAKPLIFAILASWGIAFFEYCFQVPANRLGHQIYTLPQLKIMQEVITMCVFAAFTFFVMKEKLTLNYLWASLCMVGAVFLSLSPTDPDPTSLYKRITAVYGRQLLYVYILLSNRAYFILYPER